LRLYPGPPEELSAELVHADLEFPGLARSGNPAEVPHVAINMVSTLDGKVSIGGKASPIGSRVDRLIMSNLRCAVDAVVVGAGTVRAEEMNLTVPDELSEKRKAKGLSEHPLGVILAGSGELPLRRRIFRPEGRRRNQRLVIVAGQATPGKTLREASNLGARVVRTRGSGMPEPREVLELLKDLLNVGTVLLEGGPSVNGSFLSSGVVDELFLTLSPKIFLSSRDKLSLAASHKAGLEITDFDIASVHSSPKTGELYLRYAKR
jgi:riboflavin-specific deaminase-like protein